MPSTIRIMQNKAIIFPNTRYYIFILYKYCSWQFLNNRCKIEFVVIATNCCTESTASGAPYRMETGSITLSKLLPNMVGWQCRMPKQTKTYATSNLVQ